MYYMSKPYICTYSARISLVLQLFSILKYACSDSENWDLVIKSAKAHFLDPKKANSKSEQLMFYHNLASIN